MSNYIYITPEEYARAEANGISRANLTRRIRYRGMDREEAITTPLRTSKNRKEMADRAERNGIPRATFFNRMNDLKWDEERAATEPVHDKSEITQRIKRRFDPAMVELAKKNNIPYITFYKRVDKQGMSEYEAATAPIKTKAEVAQASRKVRTKFNNWHAMSRQG